MNFPPHCVVIGFRVSNSHFLCLPVGIGVFVSEYGLIAGLVSVVAITALSATGDSLISIFEKVSTKLAEAAQ